MKKRYDMFWVLLEAGGQVNLVDKWGCTPLRLAQLFEQSQMVRGLVQKGADFKLGQLESCYIYFEETLAA
jgi:hypothetical protein